MTVVEQIKALLHLKPLPGEGGYYIETYRTPVSIHTETLLGPNQRPRSLATAIYYLLTPETFSAVHRLQADEIYHFYWGDAVELLLLSDDGTGKVVTLGQEILSGIHPQVIVPKGTWQGSRLVSGGQFALLGTTMSPGFDESDFELGSRKALILQYPQFHDRVIALTRED